MFWEFGFEPDAKSFGLNSFYNSGSSLLGTVNKLGKAMAVPAQSCAWRDR